MIVFIKRMKFRTSNTALSGPWTNKHSIWGRTLPFITQKTSPVLRLNRPS